ncbi:hypothetical protein ACHAW6_000162, partial [Cyclotella cf. meneghiniana]
ALNDAIINNIHLEDAYTKSVPAKTTQQLHVFKDSISFDECRFDFNYWLVVGKLKYLGQTTCSVIIFATHQVAKYSSNPRKEHREAILYLTHNLGLKLRPDVSKGFKCYCNADFAGNWNKDLVQIDPSTSKSQSGWVVFYAKCLVIWASKLQSQVALSTTNAEYIIMSMALRDIIPIMELMEDI